MKKLKTITSLLVASVTATAVVISVPSASAAPDKVTQKQQALQSTSLVIDHQAAVMNVPAILIKDNLLLPAKSFFALVGVNVTLEKDKLTVSKGEVRVEGKLNSLKAIKGKQTFALPTAPIVLNGRLYVPARFASLILDKDITYDRAKRQIQVGFSEAQMYQFQRLLYEAARNGDTATIKTMISRGVNVNLVLKEFGDNTALDYAITFNRTEVAQILLEQNGEFRPSNAFRVIMSGNAKMLELLLKHGLDPNYNWNSTGSILSQASGTIHSIQADRSEIEIRPSLQLVNLLLDYGADPSNDGSLSAAVNAGSYSIIQALLSKGADPYRPDSVGVTPYERAQSKGIISWLTLGTTHEIPSFAIQNNDGTPAREGSLVITNIKNGISEKSFTWSGEEAFLDVPDGDYKLINVWQQNTLYRFPVNSFISIDHGVIKPASLKLPRINIKGTITGKDEDIKIGALSISDNNGSYSFVTVVEGRFDLSLPPGTYHLGEYSTHQQMFKLEGPTDFTVSEDSPLQELTFSYSNR
ncbi:hypothetical protein EJP77_01680 [Paenibacillus zeisoli]|uniref:Copper amine oxidase-like N-terminal domain-containing protein n=1 Tax=Paenibacillus zeisoli TaxID=2496267 RepID=A0A433XNZ2_9BACL|nr:ankyrin repeat domain-containing protein [Paenibacillus zeisoli]RUT35754.1 hypothetical protein EJP77_01680 [Paenibacillus zeisoli]